MTTKRPAGMVKSCGIVAEPAALLRDVRGLILRAREQRARAVNTGLTLLRWQVGDRIRRDILRGRRAEYGAEILSILSRQLAWSHFLELIYLKDPLQREFYAEALSESPPYVEAPDRDVRETHGGPSIGPLLCARKDSGVVEHALSRAMSPTLVTEYRTRLPEKRLLQAKLHEFYQRAIEDTGPATKLRGMARWR